MGNINVNTIKRCKECGDYITGKGGRSPRTVFCSKECCNTYHRRNLKKQKTPWVKLRFEILARDNFTCQYCGRTPAKIELQIDHIYPKVKGGNDSKENLITSCSECNLGKSDVILSQRIIDNLQNR